MDRGPDICPHTIFVTVDRVSQRLIDGLAEAVRDGYADWVCIPTGATRPSYSPRPVAIKVRPR